MYFASINFVFFEKYENKQKNRPKPLVSKRFLTCFAL